MTEYTRTILEGKTVQRPRHSVAGSKQSSYEHFFCVNGGRQGTNEKKYCELWHEHSKSQAFAEP